MDRNKQVELVILSVGWLTAVMFQFIITDAIASKIANHSITDLKDELLVGFVVGFLIALGICLFAKSRIELESAFVISVGLAVFLGFWPYISVKDQTDWRYPIFFMECAPMCALVWQAMYRWVFRVNNVDANKAEDRISEVKEVKAELDPKAIAPVVIAEIKEPKKETNPNEQPAKPPKEPPEKPIQDAGWDIKL